MTTTNRADHLAKLTAARRRMAAFVASASGAHLDDTAIVRDGNIVVSGHPLECALVAVWAARMGIAGVVVAPPDADDPDWTFCNISEAGIAAAIAKAA
jgi:predicted alpha/beta hydrolase family esterase